MMTKSNTGKFFALKLCGLLPAIALPVALFGLSTAEIASPVNPEPSITITDTTNIVSMTIQDVDSGEKEEITFEAAGGVMVFNANDKQKRDSISFEDIDSISIRKNTAKEEISVMMKSGEIIAFNTNDKQKTDSITTMGTYSMSVGKDTAKTKATYTFCEDTAKTKKIYFTVPVYTVGSVDVNPEFPGGQDAMMKFIYANLKYPKEASDKKIHGRVAVEFTIHADGNIHNVKTLHSADPLLDAEAERVVKAMPAWTPGKHKGSTVAVRFVLPIVFQLKDKAAAAE
jgi:TonB family protein